MKVVTYMRIPEECCYDCDTSYIRVESLLSAGEPVQKCQSPPTADMATHIRTGCGEEAESQNKQLIKKSLKEQVAIFF